MVLDSLYKTNYSTTDTGSFSGDGIPLKYYKTSFVANDATLNGFLQAYQPAGVLNIQSGVGAGFIIRQEFAGKSAANLTAIISDHYVTGETLQGFEPVVNKLLGLGVDMSNMMKFKKFKEVLKEANSRDHNIYN